MLKEIGFEIVKQSIENYDEGDSIPKSIAKGVGSTLLTVFKVFFGVFAFFFIIIILLIGVLL